ncbi:hypothetical protein PUNSTDRAFT_114539 [Punctularia strigosozonata HHB-11173 SS5]|uniref:uncharacterized protein n=1 Tax=Punctularia strigosozonata (strain HHB-11173) TaxID=741275 RepID=UPI000441822A|nr:uncharacterized protein PUNSTDRAFT_114539 [Punctularia strigosozonata HHB-11173 SS5]EIN07034.1 hypothetical protein PUNSTDRAFT_114539 [Punctularia strigosozonata HHB-11173 SS5]
MAANSATAPAAWRQFSFFDVAPVKDVHDLANAPELFKAAHEISSITYWNSYLLLADIHGSVHILNDDFESTQSWVAHIGGRITHMVGRRQILVTLGEETGVKYPILKIWDLTSFDKKSGSTSPPTLLRSVNVQPSTKRPHPVTTVALSATLSYLAIGMGDGTVIVYRHLDQSLFSGSSSLTSLPKPRVIHESPTEPITGLGFREPTEDNLNVHLLIVTTNRVLSYQASGRGSGGAAAVVDEIGAGLGCSTMDWHAKDMVVARDEAIYLFGTEGRGQCYAYEGQKMSIHTHLNYLVIVSPPFAPSASSASATVRNFVARSGVTSGANADVTKVTVFELENGIIGYSGTFPGGVREIFSAWDEIYILPNDGKLLCLEEKPMSEKLDMLYRKGQYTLALQLAKTQKLDDTGVADIHRRYGDSLYARGEYDSAMQQYIHTLGYLQPSYVIRKFLDAQRIHNLVTYLQELHSLGLANADHTTLLLNTYTKLKDVLRLDNFIKTESRRADGKGDKDELPFDLETAIRVCRQAGYFEHASYLAKKYDRHEDYLRIQIEDAGNYKDALAYLRKLGTEAAEHNLARYGRALLDNLPDETTQLLIDICTTSGLLPSESDEQDQVVSPGKQNSAASYLSFMALPMGNMGNLISSELPTPTSTHSTASVASGVATIRPGAGDLTPRRAESGTAVAATDVGVSTPGTATPTIATGSAHARMVTVDVPLRKRPSPRVYFAHFVDHLNRFVVFLETVALKRWGQSVDGGVSGVSPDKGEDEGNGKQDQVAVWNTLLELYLTLPVEGSTSDAEKPMRDKALRLLERADLPYDPTHALILCSSRAYTPGLVLLWERLGMHEDVLRFWIDKHGAGDASASHQVVATLNKYGPSKKSLYVLVLRFLTSTSELLQKHEGDVRRVLEEVEREGVLSPVGVVQVLSRNGVASVGLVKEWLMKRIGEAREEIETDKQLTNSYRLETASKLKQVEELVDPDHPRVFHVTRCSTCNAPLDLPAVHFMCNHSYHQRCLQDHETECPQCARAHGTIREIRRNNERLADRHDLFVADVQEHGFGAVAAGFGRGVLNMPRFTEDGKV